MLNHSFRFVGFITTGRAIKVLRWLGLKEQREKLVELENRPVAVKCE
jgi:hypothetical protein